MRKRFHSGKTWLLFCSLAGALTLQAQTERDMRFSEKLNEIQLYDYSELFLRGLLKKNPTNPDRINVQLMDTLLRQNKVDDAQEIQKKIPRESENFQRANGVWGVYYLNRDPQKALSYLKPMMEYCIKTKQDPKAWEQSTAALLTLLSRQGMANEQERLLGWMQSAQGSGDRTKIYSQCSFRMDTIENAIKGEPECIKRFNEAVAEVRKSGSAADKKKLDELLAKQRAEEGKPGGGRDAAYRNLGDFLKVDLMHMKNYNQYNSKRAGVKKVYDERVTLNQSKIDELMKKGDRNDWMTNLVITMFELESVLWGGQDVASAASAALSVRGFYLMKDYEGGIRHAKKFEELFKGCDQMMADEGHPELSPGAEARVWEGYCHLALARDYAKKNDKAKAKKHYIRAFKNLGAVLKKSPKYKDGPAVFITFGQVVDELSALSPDLSAKLNAERTRLPQPSASVENEKLVSNLAEENFRQKKYNAVVEELMKVFQTPGKRLSAGFPEMLNKLVISQVLTGDYLTSLAIGDYMRAHFPRNDYTKHALKTCANLIWQKAAEAEKSAKAPAAKAKAKADKDSAIEFYRMFMQIGIDDVEAAPIALRLANEYYNRANDLGKSLNAEKNQEKRAEIRKDWLKSFDYAVEQYQFIIDHFGNREGDLNVAYLRAAECYVTTERYEQAAKAYAKYCYSDPADKVLLLQAKENVAETLYRSGAEREKKARSLLETAAAVTIPEVPAKPEEPKKPADGAPAITVEGKQIPAEEAYKKAMEAYQAETERVARLAKEADVMKQKRAALERNAQDEKNAAHDFYKQAVDQVNELNSWLASGSKVSAGIQRMIAAERDAQKKKDIPVKVDSIRKLASRLLPWLYDGIGEKQKAIDAFMAFINQNKAKNDPKDNIPGYMMRVGMLYTEIGKDDKAQAILKELHDKYPDSPEGKNANFALARNLYSNGTYAKAFDILGGIFNNAAELNALPVANLRWISSELSQCPSVQYAKTAADFSYRASIRLLEKLRNPDYKEWVGDIKAIEFQSNKAAKAQYDSQIAQKLNLDAGRAALLLEKYDDAIKLFTRVFELDKATPYFNKVFFSRAEAYTKKKDYASARKDLSKISSRAMTRSQGQKMPKYWLYNKAQTLIGESFYAENDMAKAFTIFSMVAMPALSKTAVKQMPSGDPDDDSAKYVELAIYKAALTAARLGRKTDRDTFAKGYRELYPKGIYLTEINNLPDADKK